MILADLKDSGRYENLHPLMKILLDYVKTHDFRTMKAGRIRLQGDDLFINLDDATMQPREKRPLEVHRHYIDVQIPLSTSETVGWRPLGSITQESEAPFDEERDIAFYNVPAANYFAACPGEFYVMFPEDAHAPIIGEGPIRKLIGKLRITEK